MSISNVELEKAIRNYKGFGLVTRKMIPNLNSRPLAEELYNLMLHRGCKNMIMYELVINNYEDYYSVINNAKIFSTCEEVTSYVLKGNW